MKRLDFHVHMKQGLSLDRAEYYFRDMCERHGYDGVAIMSLYYNYDSIFHECNELALKLKERLDGSYAFAALLPDEDFAVQAKRLMASGFDGIKLIRGGKPNHHRVFGHAYDSLVYDEFFSLAEQEQIPILMHNNDPIVNWDIEKAPKRAIERGWVYDYTYPSHEYFNSVLHSVLEKYPMLNIAIAHLGFFSEDLERARALLKSYPNLKFDITPALNIYFEMSEQRERSKKFFEEFSDRLIFGSDADNELVGFAREYNDKKNLITSTFLSGKSDSEHIFDGKIIRPIELDRGILDNLYYNSAKNFISAYKK
ncbi:MAG: amidohydrolase family protein [Clostridia bacterium]|nr:amidohydrolase family protein [Clostridia bacterium]